MSRSFFIVCPLLLMAVVSSYSFVMLESLSQPAVSPMDQCRYRNPGYYVDACKPQNTSELCEDLKCVPDRGDIPFEESTGPALDGTWCGAYKVCFEGTCIEDSTLQDDPFDGGDYVVCDDEDAEVARF